MNVIFDATIIANFFNKDAARSGIFFTARNILDQLLKRPDICVCFYFLSENIEHSILVHEKLYPNVPCVQNFKKYKRLINWKNKLQQLHRYFYMRRFIRKIPALGVIILNCFLKKTFECDCDSDLLTKADAYLTPIFKVPRVIRKNNSIRPFVFLYDAIPILYPNLSSAPFARDVCESTLESDVIFYISKCTQCDFERLYPKLKRCRSQIVPLAASENFKNVCDEYKILEVKKKYGIPKNKKYIFSLCSLAPHKNLKRNLRCFIRFVKENNINDLIWILGGGALAEFAEQLKKEGVLLNSDITQHIGYVDDEDLPILYSNAEWFVYTSQYEGFGLPPLEAMQCGCPVITSNNSSLPEVVGDAGIMIDWDSDEQHIKAYEKYYFNEKLRKENGCRGLERAKLFSWKKTADIVLQSMQII